MFSNTHRRTLHTRNRYVDPTRARHTCDTSGREGCPVCKPNMYAAHFSQHRGIA